MADNLLEKLSESRLPALPEGEREPGESSVPTEDREARGRIPEEVERKKPTSAKGSRNPPKDAPPREQQEKPKIESDTDDTDSSPELLFQGISNVKKRRFLAAFAQCGSVTDAARQAEIHFTSHYKWLKEVDNAAYTEAFNRSREIAGDIAESELYRRGVSGYDHPVIYEGQITTTYKAYSDTALIFFLKGSKPERYRENLNLSGSVGLPVDDFYNRIAEQRRGDTKS